MGGRGLLIITKTVDASSHPKSVTFSRQNIDMKHSETRPYSYRYEINMLGMVTSDCPQDIMLRLAEWLKSHFTYFPSKDPRGRNCVK
jgi:hypothetical protein